MVYIIIINYIYYPFPKNVTISHKVLSYSFKISIGMKIWNSDFGIVGEYENILSELIELAKMALLLVWKLSKL